ncbi:uncharacterized protein cubi_00623 [Cryptosporidium ubiquitum]|uniref:Uncharacterized protein n=1 Tax=Cryptosporidium ubiquitum TaxID=857276 RepID=A0A1J4MCW2_9CRYT|nr:uncharacterized protein cubi_00623 [Cryptosporidium ubiquitum]OII71815.1 hypothetical protein cubi_00623 [Cryptosporidium ubiquitum]
MSGETINQNNNQGIFPTHPYFSEKSVINKISLADEIQLCVDEYIQIVQFWQFNVGGTNNIVNESLNQDSGENPNILKEYLFSLLDLPGNFQNGNPFFADDLFSQSLNLYKRKPLISKRTININNFENSTNKNLGNDEETTMLENKNNFNEDIEVLESEDESDFDYEYMSHSNNEDYDELEDNTNDNDVI